MLTVTYWNNFANLSMPVLQIVCRHEIGNHTTTIGDKSPTNISPLSSRTSSKSIFEPVIERRFISSPLEVCRNLYFCGQLFFRLELCLYCHKKTIFHLTKQCFGIYVSLTIKWRQTSFDGLIFDWPASNRSRQRQTSLFLLHRHWIKFA